MAHIGRIVIVPRMRELVPGDDLRGERRRLEYVVDGDLRGLHLSVDLRMGVAELIAEVTVANGDVGTGTVFGFPFADPCG